MKKILITGATGNVGHSLVKKFTIQDEIELHVGVRNIKKAFALFANDKIKIRGLDFENGIYPQDKYDAVFLARPPHIANPIVFEKYLTTLKRPTKIEERLTGYTDQD